MFSEQLKKYSLIILTIFLCGNIAYGEDYEFVDLKEAIDIAISGNMDFLIAKKEIDISKNNIRSANRLQNPTIQAFSFFGKAGHGNPSEFGVFQVIEIAKRDPRKKLAKSQLQQTQEEVNLKEFMLKMDVRETYVNLVASKTIYNAIQSQEELLKKMREVTKKRVEVGATAEMDLIQAEIVLNQMIVQSNVARMGVETARFNFNKALNIENAEKLFDSKESKLPKNSEFTLLKTPEVTAKLPDFSEIKEKSLAQRYDIKVAKQKVDVAQKNLVTVVRQRVPDFQFGGGYAMLPGVMADDGILKHGTFLDLSLINIPVFYQYTPEINNAKIQIEQAVLNYNSTVNIALKDLQNTYEKFLIAQKNLRYYDEKLLTQSNEMMKLSQRSYEIGKMNLIDLIVMEQSYKMTVLGYTMALTDYYTSWIDFLREVQLEDLELSMKAEKGAFLNEPIQ